MLKNKIMYRQFIHSVDFVNLKMLYMFKTFVSVLSGHAYYSYWAHFCKLKMLYMFKTFVTLLSGHAS